MHLKQYGYEMRPAAIATGGKGLADRAWLAKPGILLALVATLGLSAGGVARGAQPTVTTGTWTRHQVSVDLEAGVTSGTSYTCEGMVNALTFLLKQSGARLNSQVEVVPCVEGAGLRSTAPRATLDFSTFMPASSGTPGTWRTVLFSEPHSYPALHYSDCELVQEFQVELLQYFTTRNLKYNLNCTAFQGDTNLYGLTFQTFVPNGTPTRDVGGG